MSTEGLSTVERNVLIAASRCNQDFRQVATILGMRSSDEAEKIFHNARVKLIFNTHGEMDSTWVTAAKIEKSIDASYSWVKKRLNQHFSGLRVDKAMRNGARISYYPPRVLELLREMRQKHLSHPPAGNFLTESQIAVITGYHPATIKKTLRGLGITASPRLDDSGRICDFFPPEVVESITSVTVEYPESGDWITIHWIAKNLDCDWKWVADRIRLMNIEGQLRQIPPFGKVALHFPPETFDRIARIYWRYPNAGDWMTQNTLVQRTGRSLNWVRARIHDFESELRKDPHGVLREHYPPEVLTSLLERLEEDNRGKGPRKPRS